MGLPAKGWTLIAGPSQGDLVCLKRLRGHKAVGAIQLIFGSVDRDVWLR